MFVKAKSNLHRISRMLFSLVEFVGSSKAAHRKISLGAIAASSVAVLLAIATPAAASTLEFSQKFKADEDGDFQVFGSSVALDGNYALIGRDAIWRESNLHDEEDSVYLFDIASGNLLHKFTDPDFTAPIHYDSYHFGSSIALDGNYALIGSWTEYGRDDGSAYLFDTVSGNLLHKLEADDGHPWDYFGSSVALDGDYALIGSGYPELLALQLERGDSVDINSSAYLFDVASGNLLQEFTDPDGSMLEGTMWVDDYGFNDIFGVSVALDGDLALITSLDYTLDEDLGWPTISPSAYLFDIVSGNLLHKFTNFDAESWFQSISIALDGNYALIGEYNRNDGSVYLFDTVSGNLLHKFTAPDGTENGRFGRSLALDGNYALIGSSWGGSAYLFDTVSGNLLHTIADPDPLPYDDFGSSVALDGNSALIGAPDWSNSAFWLENGPPDEWGNPGTAYLFTIPATESSEKVPEPRSVVGIIAIGALGVLQRFSSRKQKR